MTKNNKKKIVFRDIYHTHSLWHCYSRKMQTEFSINGALAQILKNYPEEYVLSFEAPIGA
jgi:hypothetical protein